MWQSCRWSCWYLIAITATEAHKNMSAVIIISHHDNIKVSTTPNTLTVTVTVTFSVLCTVACDGALPFKVQQATESTMLPLTSACICVYIYIIFDFARTAGDTEHKCKANTKWYTHTILRSAGLLFCIQHVRFWVEPKLGPPASQTLSWFRRCIYSYAYLYMCKCTYMQIYV
jgi:hypothetical protein